MLHIMQILNHMLYRLEYSEEEIRATFRDILNEELTVEELMDSIGLEFGNQHQMDRIKDKLPRWESALKVIQMRGLE
jgi:hypothetical protein